MSLIALGAAIIIIAVIVIVWVTNDPKRKDK